MGWHIGLLENTVEIDENLAKKLFKAQAYEEEIWCSWRDVVRDGKLQFNSDHMEHMDFLANNEHIVEGLKAHFVMGCIRFGSLEGDNAGSFWGYEFDGKGGMRKLKGMIVWSEE